MAIPASVHCMKSLADSDPREDKNFTELTVFSVSATARSGFLLLVEKNAFDKLHQYGDIISTALMSLSHNALCSTTTDTMTVM